MDRENAPATRINSHYLAHSMLQFPPLTLSVYHDGMWERRYIRGCAVTGEIGAESGRWCMERLGTRRLKVKYCHCNNKQGCNTAPALLQGFPVTVWAIAVGLVNYL